MSDDARVELSDVDKLRFRLAWAVMILLGIGLVGLCIYAVSLPRPEVAKADLGEPSCVVIAKAALVKEANAAGININSQKVKSADCVGDKAEVVIHVETTAGPFDLRVSLGKSLWQLESIAPEGGVPPPPGNSQVG